MAQPLRIGVCIKQVPAFAEMTLGADGRLVRSGLDLELNPYCRRAVAQGATLAATTGGSVTVVTMGPPSAADALREALAWCDAQAAPARGVHLCDPVFAGSDTLATSRTLQAALEREGPFDLILLGRNAVDADTGQVGPQLAELLGQPFLPAVRSLAITDGRVEARCELDDGYLDAATALPAVLSCAERLCDPAKVDPAGRAAVDPARIALVTGAELGPGPWGAAASPTWVGETRTHVVARRAVIDASADLDAQVERAVHVLDELGAFDDDGEDAGEAELVGGVVAATGGERCVAVLVEPDRPDDTRALLGAAAELAAALDAHVAALVAEEVDLSVYGSWGTDRVVHGVASDTEEDLAHGFGAWCRTAQPAVVLAAGTAWGRAIAARIAVQLDAGLTGDAIDLTIEDGRLVAWKPAFGGALVAAIRCRSAVEMATVRPGVLPRRTPRVHIATVSELPLPTAHRVVVEHRTRDDDVSALTGAPVVIGVGQGVDPTRYAELAPLVEVLGAELAATRKVTDQGWMPRARQLGITGRSISPRLYVAIGLSGKFNHTAGIRSARAVLAVNNDPDAPIFAAADAGIVGDWTAVLPRLVALLPRFCGRE